MFLLNLAIVIGSDRFTLLNHKNVLELEHFFFFKHELEKVNVMVISLLMYQRFQQIHLPMIKEQLSFLTLPIKHGHGLDYLNAFSYPTQVLTLGILCVPKKGNVGLCLCAARQPIKIHCPSSMTSLIDS